MNQLIESMANDIGILPYVNETDISFAYRAIYSGLGRWCLKLANSRYSGEDGVSKIRMTERLNELVQFMAIDADVNACFVNDGEYAGRLIRELYELAGCIFTGENNRLQLVQSKAAISRILRREQPQESNYLKSQYCVLDFYEASEAELHGVEYFNPNINRAFSYVWESKPTTTKTVFRTAAKDNRDYYRVIIDEHRHYIAQMPSNAVGTLDENEYRRLYYALRSHCGNPSPATITSLDERYAKLVLQSFLPAREYCVLRLIAWPDMSLFKENAFIVRAETIPQIQAMLKNIGIITR